MFNFTPKYVKVGKECWIFVSWYWDVRMSGYSCTVIITRIARRLRAFVLHRTDAIINIRAINAIASWCQRDKVGSMASRVYTPSTHILYDSLFTRRCNTRSDYPYVFITLHVPIVECCNINRTTLTMYEDPKTLICEKKTPQKDTQKPSCQGTKTGPLGGTSFGSRRCSCLHFGNKT